MERAVRLQFAIWGSAFFAVVVHKPLTTCGMPPDAPNVELNTGLLGSKPAAVHANTHTDI